MLSRISNITRSEGGYEDLHGVSLSDPTSSESSANTPTGTPSANLTEDKYRVDQAVDQLGFGKFQIKLSFLTGMAWMSDAMEMMILSMLAPALHCSWGIPSWQQAMLTTVVFGGMMISSGAWGSVCDKLGRKVALIISSAFTAYYGILSAASPNIVWMLILRALVGCGIGGAPQSVTLYAEFLPTNARARCVVLIEVFWAIGSCFEVILALVVMPSLGWRWLLILSSLPLVFFCFLCFWLPESPRFDMARGRNQAAQATLEKIAKENNKPMPLGKLASESVTTDNKPKRGRFQDLFSPELRLTTVLLWIIWLANAFSYYGIVLVTTQLFEASGSSTCSGVAKEDDKVKEPPCLLECKTLSTRDYTDLLWTTLAEFPGILITLLIIEWIGRRKTMIIEMIAFSFFVLLVNICASRGVLTFLLFTARGFITGAFQAAYVYTPEVYPTTTRALGLGTCSGMARIGAIVTPFVAQVLLKKSIHVAISLYGAIGVLAAVAIFLLPIETKGRVMKDSAD